MAMALALALAMALALALALALAMALALALAMALAMAKGVTMEKSWDLLLIDVRTELLCALCQMTEKDDKIIAGHVRKAADLLHKMILRLAWLLTDRDQVFDR